MTFTESAPNAPATVPPAVSTDGSPRLEDLRSALSGEVVLPADPGWESARRAWQLLVAQHPVAVVVPADTADVVTTIHAARRLGLRVAPQNTGHAAATVPSLADAILLRTSELRTVDIDPDSMVARVGAGALWSDVVGPAGMHGLAAVTGMAPSVGVVGFVLGGGLGWLGRSHGLAANSLLSIEGVDADGRVIRANATENADLFWAVRGGVAPVVVTSIELRLYPITTIHAGSLLWPIERAAEVVGAWREWIADVPASVTSLARVLRLPPIPDLPPFLRGRAFAAIEVAIGEDEQSAAAMLAPLRALLPEIDMVRTMSPAELGSIHGDPAQPSPGLGGSVLVAELSEQAVDAFVDVALGDSSTALVSVEIRHLGGELAVERGEGGAVAGIDGAGLVFAIGMVPSPEAYEPVRAGVAAVTDRLAAFASARQVKNFVETPADGARLYGDALEGLRRVALKWDPQQVILTGHPIG